MQTLKKYSRTYLSLIILFTVLMTLVYLIPNSLVEKQNSLSNIVLNIEGEYPNYLYGTVAAMLDNHTDSHMINKAYVEENINPLYDAMDAEGYARYWHGYQIVLRPLMTVFSYRQIRYINSFLLLGLMSLLIAKLYKVSGLKIALPLFLGLSACYFIIIPASLQFSSVFYIATIAGILIVNKRNTTKQFDLNIFFFVVGSITNFVDYLTVPMITLGIPLLIYLGLKANADEHFTFKEIFFYSLSWILGYAFTWIAKWAIGSLVLQRNIFLEAFEAVLFRTGSDLTYRFEAILTNFNLMFLNQGNRVGLIWILLIAGLMILFIFHHQNVKANLNLLPIAVYPYIWYFVLSNHSMIHYWFTYRLQLITIFSVILFFALSIDFDYYKGSLQKVSIKIKK